jgi:hypothetical protein
MKHNENNSNMNHEGNIVPTHSTNSDGFADASRFAFTPGPGRWLQKSKTLLWLALPLTLAAGCASNPHPSARVDSFFPENPAMMGAPVSGQQTANNPDQSARADSFYPETPATIATPVSGQQAANMVVGREIFDMFMAEKNINYSARVSVNAGVVTLDRDTFDGAQRQGIVDQMWKLDGVNQVENDQGVDLKATPVAKVVAVR